MSALHAAEHREVGRLMLELRDIRAHRKAAGNPSVRCRPLSSGMTDSSSGRTVHWMRHGQGFHNAFSQQWFDSGKGGTPWADATCPIDPSLTALGEREAQGAREGAPSPQLVIVSPLKRAIQTATLAFDAVLPPKGPPFVAVESVRETMGAHRCDRRLCASTHAAAFPHVDFSLLHDASSDAGGAPKEGEEGMEDAVFNEWGDDRETQEAVVERGKWE